MNASKMSRRRLILGIVMAILLSGSGGVSASTVELSEGRTVYVPVYSHIYVGIKKLTFDLAISLIIRNTDTVGPITVISVGYFNSDGRLAREFLKGPIQVAPLAAVDFFVGEDDTSGGAGAAFVVKWKSESKVNAPVIEGVMAGTKSGQGISFTTRGQNIEDRRR